MVGERSEYSGRDVVDVLDREFHLYDVDGDKVGRVVEINPDFLVVESGGWFSNDVFFVPRSAVTGGEDDDRFQLNIDKDQLGDMGWDSEPTESTYRQDADAGSQGSQSYQGYQGAADQGGGTRIRRYEEQVEAQTTQRQAGEVEVHKDVVEEVQTFEVPVRREEVRVERRPVSGDAGTGEDAFQGDTLRVPVMEEQVEVRKVPRAVEEIEIGKVATQGTERVEETVRKERIDIDDQSGRVSGS